jgi:hypothetical protein
MDPRVFAPWIRGGNTNTLQAGVQGDLLHIQTPAFFGGVSIDPLQRAGMAPLPVFVVMPAPATPRTAWGEKHAPFSGATPGRPLTSPVGPFDPFLGNQV